MIGSSTAVRTTATQAQLCYVITGYKANTASDGELHQAYTFYNNSDYFDGCTASDFIFDVFSPEQSKVAVK